MGLSTHPPWRSLPARWLQPGTRTPTSRSTPRAPGPCAAWGSPVRAASRPGCSVAHRRSAHRGTCTGTYSWGKRSGRSDRQNRPVCTLLPHELQGKKGFLVSFISQGDRRATVQGLTGSSWHDLPTQMPVLLWMSAPYSHCSPLRVSQGFISEHTCPL